jgi:hypothetical protein
MPTETFLPPGDYTIPLAGRSNFTIDQAWSSGGSGDGSPAARGGYLGNGSQGGGGGCCVTNVAIPDADLVGQTDLRIHVGDVGEATTISLNDDFILAPGEDGASCSDLGDQSEGGFVVDNPGWITDLASQFSRGAPSNNDNIAQVVGYGGGSSGGLDGAAAFDNADGQTGGHEPDGSSDGIGGNGGNAGANGQPGTFPGGGGGGAGLGIGTTGGAGATGKVVISYFVGDPAQITSSDAFSVVEGNTAVEEGSANGTPPITWSITGGADAAKFEFVDTFLNFLVAPVFATPTDVNSDNVYEVEITAANAAGSTSELVFVTVTEDPNEPPIVTLTPGSPTWTNTTGGDVLVLTLEATGPGQDGQGPQTRLGVGGEGWNGETGNAELGGSGQGGSPDNNPYVAINGRAVIDPDNAANAYSPGSYDIGPFETDVAFRLIGGGGAASATAGGGSGSKVEGVISGDPEITYILTVGEAGEPTTLIGPDGTAHADFGKPATGDTPGNGGGSDPADFPGATAISGNPGTGPTLRGGNGGNAGNWASANCGAGVLIANGDTITLVPDSTYSLVYQNYNLPSQDLLLSVSFRGGDAAITNLPGGILAENQGGLGESTGTTLGGRGGGSGAEGVDGIDGADRGDPPTPEDESGADGEGPGIGGYGSGAFGTTGGSGQLGYAVFTYAVVEPGGNENDDEATTSFANTFVALGSL